jgi:glutamate-1-semialdehyde aminotransferase
MMNEGVLPQPPGPDEQWTVTVQHSEADVDAHLAAFRKVAPLLKTL